MNDYIFIYHVDGEYALLNKETKLLEFFVANKGFTGYAIPFRNTRLEFCRSYNEAQMSMFVRGINAILNFGEQHPSFTYAFNVAKKLKANGVPVRNDFISNFEGAKRFHGVK